MTGPTPCPSADWRRSIWPATAVLVVAVFAWAHVASLMSDLLIHTRSAHGFILDEQRAARGAVQFDSLTRLMPERARPQLIVIAVRRLAPEDRAAVCARLSAQFTEIAHACAGPVRESPFP